MLVENAGEVRCIYTRSRTNLQTSVETQIDLRAPSSLPGMLTRSDAERGELDLRSCRNTNTSLASNPVPVTAVRKLLLDSPLPPAATPHCLPCSEQMRETRREQLATLRSKFEQDKARVAKLKEQRKFRPF